MNSSTYSSIASSLSAASSSALSSSSNTSASSSVSISSSPSTSPKQTVVNVVHNSSSSAAPHISNPPSILHSNKQQTKPATLTQRNENQEILHAEAHDLGKTAKILEHRLLAASKQTSDARQSVLSSVGKLVASALDFAPNVTTNASAPPSSNVQSSNWKTISNKRDKQRQRKPIEKKVFAGEIPGNIGEKSVNELEDYIQSGNNTKQHKNNGKHKMNNNSTTTSSNKTTNPYVNQTIKKSELTNQNKPQYRINSNRQNNVKVEPKSVDTKPPQPIKTEDTNSAVTFASHLAKIAKDDVSKAVQFGFFTESQPQQPPQHHQQLQQHQQHQHQQHQQTKELKRKPKKFKPSHINYFYDIKSNKKENINFNYAQILKYISNAWRNSTQDC